MKDIFDFLRQFPGIPMDYVLALLAFAALGLAAFTLHVIHSIVKRDKSQ